MMTIRSDAPVATDVHDRVGEVLGDRWRLDDVLGIGGMAVVYAATHRNGARVAIKLPRGDDPALTSRFVKEGWIGNRVDHPGVVKTLDDGVTADGLPFLVMERLSGETLEDRLDREGRLPLPEVVRIVSEVCDVLAAAHAAGVVHRDVKPSNVFLTSDGGVKLLDFGIAREVVRAERGADTIAGVTLGTPGFLPPEQAMGLVASIGPPTDVFAAGALAFAALTGTTVHGGETPLEKVAAAMIAVRPVRMLAPEIPRPLAKVLDRALAYDVGTRFASALEMKHALLVAMTATASGGASQPRGRVRAIGLAAGGAAIAAWIVVGAASMIAFEDDGARASPAEGAAPAAASVPAPSATEVASATASASASSAATAPSDVRRPAVRGGPRRSPRGPADPMAGRF